MREENLCCEGRQAFDEDDGYARERYDEIGARECDERQKNVCEACGKSIPEPRCYPSRGS
jgi:hypothetical protein